MLTAAEQKTGETIFKQKCFACHPNGGNARVKTKTLKAADLAAAQLDTVDAMTRHLRKPGPGMTPYDLKSLPNTDARLLAEYIFKTFR